MAKKKKKDLWWYIKNEYGLPAMKRKFSKETGNPYHTGRTGTHDWQSGHGMALRWKKEEKG